MLRIQPNLFSPDLRENAGQTEVAFSFRFMHYAEPKLPCRNDKTLTFF
jgi:hypothetical protein